MKQLVILFVTVLSIMLNCKEPSSTNEKKYENSDYKNNVEKIPLNLVNTKETRKDFEIDSKKFVSEFNIDGNIVQIATKKEANGFSYEIYSNKKAIAKTENNSWTYKPFYFKNKNIGLLFIENGDEGGIWGYTVILIKNKIFINLGFIDISSTQNTSLEDFIKLNQVDNFVEFTFIEPKIFIEDQEKNSNDFILRIDLNEQKIIKSENTINSTKIVEFNLENTQYKANFSKKTINPSNNSNIKFENEYLTINQKTTDNNPHDIKQFKYFFEEKSNSIKLNKIEFNREVYVENDEICKTSYTYTPSTDVILKEVPFADYTYLNSLVRVVNLKQLKELVLNTNKEYQCTDKVKIEELQYLFSNEPLSEKNLNDYNNVAYYLEQNNEYKTSQYLLDKILTKYPNRTVAWLNMGDVNWALNEKTKAKEAYKKYISLMKSQNKDLSKIPQRVYERSK